MNSSKNLALVGATLLIIGAFCPLVRFPIVGDINYFHNGMGDGVLIVILAVATAGIALADRVKWASITGGAALLVMIMSFLGFHTKITELKNNLEIELADNPFKEFADVAINSVQMQWGWAVLLLGAMLTIYAGWSAARAPKINMSKTPVHDNPSDTLRDLERLNELRQAGTLTEAEFLTQKSTVLYRNQFAKNVENQPEVQLEFDGSEGSYKVENSAVNVLIMAALLILVAFCISYVMYATTSTRDAINSGAIGNNQTEAESGQSVSPQSESSDDGGALYKTCVGFWGHFAASEREVGFSVEIKPTGGYYIQYGDYGNSKGTWKVNPLGGGSLLLTDEQSGYEFVLENCASREPQFTYNSDGQFYYLDKFSGDYWSEAKKRGIPIALD